MVSVFQDSGLVLRALGLVLRALDLVSQALDLVSQALDSGGIRWTGLPWEPYLYFYDA